MGVFHVFYIVQMVPNRATHHIVVSLKTALPMTDIMVVLGSAIAGFVIFLTLEMNTWNFDILELVAIGIHFLCFRSETPFLGKFGPKNQIC